VTLAAELAVPVAPATAIPAQLGPGDTISLTQGCETPLDALKTCAAERPIRCHPCDEAVVRLLLARARRTESDLVVSTAINPGTLALG
jgi:hypothetical protein